MDSFELNKVLGAILGTLLFVMGVGFLAEAIYEPAKGPGPGYELPEPVADQTPTNDVKTVVVDIGTLLAKADPKAGEASAKKCASCHDFTSGGPNKIGPNLYDVVERPIASHPGFGYSDALLKLSGDKWTYEHLNTWLISPKAMVPGTKMGFAGIKDDAERANVIAYLSTLSASPKPFPAPQAASSSEASSAASSAEASSSAAPAASSSEAPAASSSEAPAAPSSAASEAPASSSSAAQ